MKKIHLTDLEIGGILSVHPPYSKVMRYETIYGQMNCYHSGCYGTKWDCWIGKTYLGKIAESDLINMTFEEIKKEYDFSGRLDLRYCPVCKQNTEKESQYLNNGYPGKSITLLICKKCRIVFWPK